MGKILNYILYQTVNTVNKKIYIGVHQTASLDFDGYIGQDIWVNRPSTIKYPKTHFAKAVKKYGFKAFIRTTLATYNTMEEALKAEKEIVNQEFIERPDTYNMVLGGRMNIVPTNAQAVYVYDLEGNFVKEFSSASKAAIFIFGKASALPNVTRALKRISICNDKWQVSKQRVDNMPNFIKYKGTKWEKEIERYYTNKRKADTTVNPKPVIQYTDEGDIVKIWKSLSDCRRAGYTNVQRVVEGRCEHCKGYRFKYKEQD